MPLHFTRLMPSWYYGMAPAWCLVVTMAWYQLDAKLSLYQSSWYHGMAPTWCRVVIAPAWCHGINLTGASLILVPSSLVHVAHLVRFEFFLWSSVSGVKLMKDSSTWRPWQLISFLMSYQSLSNTSHRYRRIVCVCVCVCVLLCLVFIITLHLRNKVLVVSVVDD